jgi:hypothetical protein
MFRALLTLVFACLPLTGCIIAEDPVPVVVTRGYGLLTVAWTLQGSDDPALCDLEGADTIDIFVERSDGAPEVEVSDLCEVFVTSVELRPGGYYADALLLDVRARPVTTAVDLGFFEIYGDDELVIDVDFPASSFY